MHKLPTTIASIKPDQTYGRWTVAGKPFVRKRLPDGSRIWSVRCVCSCGTVRDVDVKTLRFKHSRSCGCLKAERRRTHGGSKTRLFRIWSGMRDRCRYKHEKRYGGRGIKVCGEWQTFAAFRMWALANGYADGLTIDRRDNDGDYTPENCRWVTRGVNAQNTCRTRLITAFGETKHVREWERDARCVVTDTTIIDRLRRGWTPEEAISYPALKGRQRKT